MSTVLRVSIHIYWVSEEIDGKTFIFHSKPRHVTPQIDRLMEKWALFWGFQHTFMWVSQEIDWKPFIFRVNLGMWPQIDHLGKTSPVLRISTHIYGVSKDIGGKMFIFRINPGMWPLKLVILEKMSTVMKVSIHIYGVSQENIHFQSKPRPVTIQNDCLGKTSTVLRVSTHIYGVSQGHRWENIHFSTKPRHVTPQINHLWKTIPVLKVSIHIYGVSEEIDGKTFIFRVNLGIWPLKSMVSEKQALFWEL